MSTKVKNTWLLSDPDENLWIKIVNETTFVISNGDTTSPTRTIDVSKLSRQEVIECKTFYGGDGELWEALWVELEEKYGVVEVNRIIAETWFELFKPVMK